MSQAVLPTAAAAAPAEQHCGVCERVLCRCWREPDGTIVVEIKCPRCKEINQVLRIRQ